jgi:NADPH:quinone reductase-like Zn-dependent oxidoreductase
MGNSTSYPTHPKGETMKAVVFSGYGKPDEKLALADIPVPGNYNKARAVLIKVHAAAINPVDKMLVSGGLKLVKPVAGFPHVVSYDAAGVVAVADEAGVFAVGDEVMVRLFGPSPADGAEAKTPYYRGSMAEYCVAQTEHVARKPAGVSFEEAASVPLAGLTAMQCLAGLKPGQRVLITGGAGGVGSLAIQLAKTVFKAGFVVTTASAGEKAELCTSLGADKVVDYHSESFADLFGQGPEKFDVCFDCTGESLQMAAVVKQGGRIVSIASKPTLEAIQSIGGTGCILAMVLAKTAKRAEYKAAQKAGAEWKYHFLQPSNDDIVALAGHLESGAVKAVVDGVWDAASDWKGAFDRAFSGRAKGKCVVRFVGQSDGAVAVVAE